MTVRYLLLATLPWVLVSQVAVQHCDPGGCVPSPDVPLRSVRELGRYATQPDCERARERLAQAWQQVEREADRDRPPQDTELRLVTTFRCVPAPAEDGH
jgi:hypothetical protein